MGYMRHHAIVVSSFSEDSIREAHVAAGIFGLEDLRTPITPARMNSYSSFCIVPDGSTEGWEDSDKADGQRGKFIEWLESKALEDGSSYFDWVLVQFGDGDLETIVCNDSDAKRRDDLASAVLTP